MKTNLSGPGILFDDEDFVLPIKMVTYDLSKLVLWKTLIMRCKPLNMTDEEASLWKLLYEDDDT